MRQGNYLKSILEQGTGLYWELIIILPNYWNEMVKQMRQLRYMKKEWKKQRKQEIIMHGELRGAYEELTF